MIIELGWKAGEGRVESPYLEKQTLPTKFVTNDVRLSMLGGRNFAIGQGGDAQAAEVKQKQSCPVRRQGPEATLERVINSKLAGARLTSRSKAPLPS